MPISNNQPIVIPPVESQIFSEWFVTQINFKIKSPSEGFGTIELKPYDPVNEDILDEPRVIFFENIWDTAEKVPEIAYAINSIISGVAAFDEYQNKNLAEELPISEEV